MGLFDGMMGGGPMPINADGAAALAGGQQGGGLLGMNFGGQQPLMNMGGQGTGLLGFGSPGQGGMNPMMRFGMGMAGQGGMMPQQPQQQPQMQMPQQQPLIPTGQGLFHQMYGGGQMQQPPGGFNPHRLY